MGSGDAERARKEAEFAEFERQSRIADATRRIDALFDSPRRQRQYQDFVSALRQYFTQDANRQKEIADRNLRFSLARSGLTGGSAAIDAGRLLSDEYNRGLLEAERRAQGALGDLMAEDQAARLNLLQVAQSGADTSSAYRRAADAMRTSLASGRAEAMSQGLGDIFGGTAALYKRQQEAAAFRRGQQTPLGSPYGNPFTR